MRNLDQQQSALTLDNAIDQCWKCDSRRNLINGSWLRLWNGIEGGWRSWYLPLSRKLISAYARDFRSFPRIVTHLSDPASVSDNFQFLFPIFPWSVISKNKMNGICIPCIQELMGMFFFSNLFVANFSITIDPLRDERHFIPVLYCRIDFMNWKSPIYLLYLIFRQARTWSGLIFVTMDSEVRLLMFSSLISVIKILFR